MSLPIDIWEQISMSLDCWGTIQLMIALSARTRFFKSNSYCINRLRKLYYSTSGFDPCNVEIMTPFELIKYCYKLHVKESFLAALRSWKGNKNIPNLEVELGGMNKFCYSVERHTGTFFHEPGVIDHVYGPNMTLDFYDIDHPENYRLPEFNARYQLYLADLNCLKRITNNAEDIAVFMDTRKLTLRNYVLLNDGVCRRGVDRYHLIMPLIDYLKLLRGVASDVSIIYKSRAGWLIERQKAEPIKIRLRSKTAVSWDDISLDFDVDSYRAFSSYHYVIEGEIDATTDEQTGCLVLETHCAFEIYQDIQFKEDVYDLAIFNRHDLVVPPLDGATIECGGVEFEVQVVG